MVLDLGDCVFFGHALPEPFVKMDLEGHLDRAKLLPKTTGPEAKALGNQWDAYRRKLRALGENAGPVRVANHVFEPLTSRLGYATFRREAEVITREGPEDGGYLFETADGATRLRAWAVDAGADLDAPTRRGHAYRYSPSQVAQRVLLEKGERVGLLTDGETLRLLLCDPAPKESAIAIRLDRSSGWRGDPRMPDSYRLLIALAQPAGVAKIPELVELARLSQTRVTATLREQAKQAIQSFVQEVLDDPKNRAFFAGYTDKQDLAHPLFRDALVLVYRLLFILKLDAEPDPARGFSFASSSLWRNTYAPSTALGPIVRKALDEGAETGEMVAGGLRSLFRLFQEGFRWSEMRINKLGGMLFGEDAAPLLDDKKLHWSEQAAAKLLDHLLWTPRGTKGERQRVHYGPLYVEDLGRVYEALLELEPGIATEPMCRLRRQKLEVVAPRAQGDAYRGNAASGKEAADEDESEEEGEEDEKPSRGKTRVVWVEDIREGEFYLRVGLGRKATGSYYTPHAFVRFLIQETLGPQVEERSPEKDPRPAEILKLKVLDPAMGSGHFLVEACRYLGEKLYEACRACDAKATEAEQKAEKAGEVEKEALLAEAMRWRGRVVDLPDPNDEMLAYLPSRSKEGEAAGVSDAKAKAIARRLVAVHCLYGVDKNPLAVELAKLSLWLESYAEGLPLTFLDHRLIVGDSLTGPFFEKLATYPKSGEDVRDLFTQKLTDRLKEVLREALVHIRELEASIGKDAADIQLKRAARNNLDLALAPLKQLSAAWSGGVMLGEQASDDDYTALMKVVVAKGDVDALIAARPVLERMVKVGMYGVAYDLMFPEVFYPDGQVGQPQGFDAVVGNPPWDAIKFNTKEFLASFDIGVLDAPTKRERDDVEKRVLLTKQNSTLFAQYQEGFEAIKRANDRNFNYQKITIEGDLAGRQLDAFRVFTEKSWHLITATGRLGLVVPSAFHVSAGAAGVRGMLLHEDSIQSYFSFVNNRKIFEISAGFRFGLLVCSKRRDGNRQMRVAFDLDDPDILVADPVCGAVILNAELVRRLSPYLTFPALGSQTDVEVLSSMLKGGMTFATWSSLVGLSLRSTPTAIHMTHEAKKFATVSSVFGSKEDPRDIDANDLIDNYEFIIVQEGKTFHQYDDRWGAPPRYCMSVTHVSSDERWSRILPHFKLAIRAIVGSGENKGIASLLRPGQLAGNSALIEGEPNRRRSSDALLAVAVLNSSEVNWLLGISSDLNINLFLIRPLPWPARASVPFLAHSALRLTCNHEGYAPLWKEQLGDAWREPTPKHTWPVLAGGDARWAVRAAIDAVVADAYGLTRDHYAHVLSSFSHKSYPKAPERCLAAFDELKRIGLDAFVKTHDPYADIPLNEGLPKPVLDLSAPDASSAVAGDDGSYKLTISEPAKKRGGKKRT